MQDTGAYDRPEAVPPQAVFLWRLVLSFAAVTREAGLHHLFQSGRQPRPSYVHSPTGSLPSRKIGKLHLVQEAGQIKY